MRIRFYLERAQVESIEKTPGDVAYAVWQYWQATEDVDFLVNHCGSNRLPIQVQALLR